MEVRAATPRHPALGLTWRPYRFRLPQALVTAHGALAERRGWLLRLEGPDRLGWGEAVAWPGQEAALEAALSPLVGAWTRQALEARLPALPPALAFAVAAALEEQAGGPLDRDGAWLPAPPSAWLLPAGEAALAVLEERLATNPAAAQVAQPGSPLAGAVPGPGTSRPAPAAGEAQASGGLTLKWKVGACDDALERQLLERLLELMPAEARLRLDANGGWDRATARAWAERLQDERRLQWLEQPLPPGDREGLEQLAQRLPVALDESLRHQPRWRQDWPGWQVRRPLLEGDPRPLLQALRRGRPRLMLSTALETGIGRRWVAHLAALQQRGPTPVAPGLAPGWRPTGALFAADPERVWEAAGLP